MSWWPPIVEKCSSTQNGRRTRCNGLCELKKKDEEKRMKLEHPKLVGNMINSAAGGTGLLHKITKPTAGRVQILKEEEEDAKPSARCEEKGKNGQNTGNVTRRCSTSKTGRVEMKNGRVGKKVRRGQRKKELEKAATTCQAKTGVGCDGFHVQVPLDLFKEVRGAVLEFLEEVEQCGGMAAASLHDLRLSLYPKFPEREAHCASADNDSTV